ncbi:MAG: hypothetical protein IKC82_01620 [Lentisphaeria bacterium]|nr:hypothetical protein [Lentisphaeria bacterium]
MDLKITAAEAEKNYSQQPFKVELLDAMTGRVRVNCRRDHRDVSGKWQLEIDGVRHSFGQFLLKEISAGESRDFLFSIEVPDLVYGSEAVLVIFFYDQNGTLLAKEGFAVPPPAYILPPSAENCFTGVRFDVSQAIISSGKLSAVIDANGMRELRYNGVKLLTGGPRLSLYRSGMIPANLSPLKLDRLRVSADRFVSDGRSIECHALALPTLMEMDELEFTQRFTPQTDGTIRYDVEFVVPESFAGIPRLGVVLRLPREMSSAGYYGYGPYENYPGTSGMVRSLYTLKAEESYPEYSKAVSGGSRSGVKKLTVSDGDQRQLRIIAGSEFSFALLPFDEFAIDEAARNGKSPSPESENCLYLDCRIGDKQPVASGLYRMTLFFGH